MDNDIPVVCKVCGSKNVKSYAKATVRKSYEASYWQCSTCDFVFPHPCPWLEEAYLTAINPSDVGYVSRNIEAANFLAGFLSKTEPNSYFVDYGAGYGMLVRLMRDRGFKFQWNDLHCENLFARYCETFVERFVPYRALVAVEVFEHLIDPLASLSEMLTFSSCIIFTTELIPDGRPDPHEWWYFGLEHGQHISLFTSKALQSLASKNGLVYQRLSPVWHIICAASDSLLRSKPMQSQSNSLISKVKRHFFKPNAMRNSLLWEDFCKIRMLIDNPEMDAHRWKCLDVLEDEGI